MGAAVTRSLVARTQWRPGAVLVGVAVVAALGAGLAPSAMAEAEAPPCPNEQLRQESNVNAATGQPYSTQLPDCRAYELVSPPETGGVAVASLEDASGSPQEGAHLYQVAANGSVFFVSRASLPETGMVPDGRSLDVFVSRRGPSGWSTRDLTPFGTPGDNELIAGAADGSAALISAYVSLSPEDIDNPVAALPPAFGYGMALDLYRVDEAQSPVFVSHGTLPRMVPSAKYFEEPGIEAPYVFNSSLTAVGFTSTAPLSPEGVSPNATDCYSWSEAGARVAVPTNNDDGAYANCALLGMTPNGLAIFEDKSGDSYSGGIFVDSVGIGSRGSSFPGGTAPAVQLSGSNPYATTFDDIAPTGSLAYVTTTEAFAPSLDTNASNDLYAVDIPLFPKATTSPTENDVTCISCVETVAGGSATFVAQSPDGSHVFFSISAGAGAAEQGLWSWNWGTDTATRITEATDVSQLVSSRNGEYAVGLTGQLAGNPNGTRDVYEFSAGQAPKLITSGALSDAYTLTASNLVVEGQLDLTTLGGVSNDGQQVIYDDRPGNGGPEVVDEWSSGQTTQISPLGATHQYLVLGTAGDELEDVFFLAHQPLVAQDDNAGTTDIYDARLLGGFSAPSESADEAKTPNPRPPAPPAYTGDLTPSYQQPAELPTDTSHSSAVARSLTRAQRLAKALKACKKQSKRKRVACEVQAKKKYGAKVKAKKIAKGGK